ncbi:MAG: hypothetical protein GY725_19605 [bacterium]|nr:hypothetical protein [bacterium]
MFFFSRNPSSFALVACLAASIISGSALAEPLPRGPAVEIELPDYLTEVREFRSSPPAWNETIVNAASGHGTGAGATRETGWWRDPDNWLLIDYVDRSGNLTTHQYLETRGIFAEIYGNNEYQETIHFHEDAALKLFGENGIARGIGNEKVIDPHHNLRVKRWTKKQKWNAWITDNKAPRWSAVINYDWLTSPLFGDSISQDNIGGATSRIGEGARGRYDDFNSLKFRHFLTTSGRLQRLKSKPGSDPFNIRTYAATHLKDLFDKIPPYVEPEAYLYKSAREAAGRITDDPVMAEYQRFQYVSELHSFQRYYRENKLIASRSGRSYDVHGNLGGSFPGRVPYAVALGDSVDMLWFEASGQSQYDIFKNGWSNAWGSFRLQLAEAMARGRKPYQFLPNLGKTTRDLLVHEWAEMSAGGAVFLHNPVMLQRDHPELLDVLREHLVFREMHRAIFERRGRERYAQVGLLYSVPTLMHAQYVPTILSMNIPPVNDLAGAARALEEGHLPYGVVLLEHPDLGPYRISVDDLRKYRVLIAPSITDLSRVHTEILKGFLETGGALVVLGEFGTRDENHGVAAGKRLEELRKFGTVVQPLGDGSFQSSRSRRTAKISDRSRRVHSAVRAVLETPILDGALPEMLWAKTWVHHKSLLSIHLVNYDIDFESGEAAEIASFPMRLRAPEDLLVEAAVFLVPGRDPIPLQFKKSGLQIELDVPAMDVYGVILLGPRDLGRTESLVRRGDRYLMRAKHAARGVPELLSEVAELGVQRGFIDAAKYASAGTVLLQKVAKQREQALRDEHLAMREAPRNVTIALDFGEARPLRPWQGVDPNSPYDSKRGFGWLKPDDISTPTPEERDYRLARRAGDTQRVRVKWTKSQLWPYEKTLREPPLRRSVISGRAQRFRVDVPDGRYRVHLIQTNAGWAQRNFLVSGLTRVGGEYALLDTPLSLGQMLRRSFEAQTEEGSLIFEFGGPTGFGLAALAIEPIASASSDPLEIGGLRKWQLSPRYANPDWYPIRETRAPPERALASPDTEGWSTRVTPLQGLPVVDLGPAQHAVTGDVVYAVAYIERETPEDVWLSLGASSSAAAWLNGKSVAYLPNLKGITRDEARVPVRLRAGRNVLLLKLSRFWERRWLFYASVLARDD